MRMRGLFGAHPNRAHYALAELEKMGLLKAVITQNIDGLHQKAGSKNVIEIHGSMRRSYCGSCYRQYSSSEILTRMEAGEIPPKCQCGGVIRPDVVLFGEPVRDFSISREIALQTDLVLSVGSSLTVYPANMIPQIVKGNGGKLIIVNMEETPLDDMADEVVRDPIEEFLPCVLEEVKRIL